MEASLLLFVIIQVYVERERDSRRLRARSLTDFCYDTHISIMTYQEKRINFWNDGIVLFDRFWTYKAKTH